MKELLTGKLDKNKTLKKIEKLKKLYPDLNNLYKKISKNLLNYHLTIYLLLMV